MKILYKTKAVSVGGREGKVKVENSPLEFELATPVELGGTGKIGVNPEQLFASGYAACYDNALLHVARRKKIELGETSVAVEIGMGAGEKGAFVLVGAIEATFSGIDQETADMLVQEAHKVCPYSNATRGNVEISVKAIIK